MGGMQPKIGSMYSTKESTGQYQKWHLNSIEISALTIKIVLSIHTLVNVINIYPCYTVIPLVLSFYRRKTDRIIMYLAT